jgi:hypothetical protein
VPEKSLGQKKKDGAEKTVTVALGEVLTTN